MDSADSLEGEVGDDELEAVAHARDDGASRPKPECNELGDDGVDLAVERAVGERPGAVDERDRRSVPCARPANAGIDGQADRHEPAERRSSQRWRCSSYSGVVLSVAYM
jgi:hypothetical protein